MTSIAKLLGISSVSLGKTCERRGIPTPTRGYWQKLAAGRDMPHRPPLGEVEAELPIPWNRTPSVDSALARLMPLSKAVALGLPAEAPPERAKVLESTQPDGMSQASAGMVDTKIGLMGERQSLPADVETAIRLARRIEDLRALNSLTELALEASAALPACEEDCLKTWVTLIRSAMRDIDPLRQLVEGARAMPTAGAGKECVKRHGPPFAQP